MSVCLQLIRPLFRMPLDISGKKGSTFHLPGNANRKSVCVVHIQPETLRAVKTVNPKNRRKAQHNKIYYFLSL